MTQAEFKAWFGGFTEAIDKVPTKAQWARIKERVAEIDGTAVTEKVFIEQYQPLRSQQHYPYWNGVNLPFLGTASNFQGLNSTNG